MKRFATTLMAVLLLLLGAQAHTITINDESVEGRNVRRILFDKENIKLVYDDDTESDLVNKGLIIFDELTGLKGMRVYTATAAVSGDVLTLKGLDPAKGVTVFDTNGRQVLAMEATRSEVAIINIGHLNDGVYVLRNGQNVIKFVKR